jgi:hypothetical protein
MTSNGSRLRSRYLIAAKLPPQRIAVKRSEAWTIRSAV